MFDEQDLNADARKLEAALSRLRPRESEIDSHRLAYNAGRRDGRRSIFAYRAAAGILFAALGASLLIRPAPRTGERVVYIQPQTAPRYSNVTATSSSGDESSSDSAFAYIRLRRDVLDRDSDVLPVLGSPAGANPILRAGSLIQQRGNL
jgi:hypothetical protein